MEAGSHNWLPFFLPELGIPEYMDFTFPNQTHISNNTINITGQPNTTNIGNVGQIVSNQWPFGGTILETK